MLRSLAASAHVAVGSSSGDAAHNTSGKMVALVALGGSVGLAAALLFARMSLSAAGTTAEVTLAHEEDGLENGGDGGPFDSNGATSTSHFSTDSVAVASGARPATVVRGLPQHHGGGSSSSHPQQPTPRSGPASYRGYLHSTPRSARTAGDEAERYSSLPSQLEWYDAVLGLYLQYPTETMVQASEERMAPQVRLRFFPRRILRAEFGHGIQDVELCIEQVMPSDGDAGGIGGQPQPLATTGRDTAAAAATVVGGGSRGAEPALMSSSTTTTPAREHQRPRPSSAEGSTLPPVVELEDSALSPESRSLTHTPTYTDPPPHVSSTAPSAVRPLSSSPAPPQTFATAASAVSQPPPEDPASPRGRELQLLEYTQRVIATLQTSPLIVVTSESGLRPGPSGSLYGKAAATSSSSSALPTVPSVRVTSAPQRALIGMPLTTCGQSVPYSVVTYKYTPSGASTGTYGVVLTTVHPFAPSLMVSLRLIHCHRAIKPDPIPKSLQRLLSCVAFAPPAETASHLVLCEPRLGTGVRLPLGFGLQRVEDPFDENAPDAATAMSGDRQANTFALALQTAPRGMHVSAKGSQWRGRDDARDGKRCIGHAPTSAPAASSHVGRSSRRAGPQQQPHAAAVGRVSSGGGTTDNGRPSYGLASAAGALSGTPPSTSERFAVVACDDVVAYASYEPPISRQVCPNATAALRLTMEGVIRRVSAHLVVEPKIQSDPTELPKLPADVAADYLQRSGGGHHPPQYDDAQGDDPATPRSHLKVKLREETVSLHGDSAWWSPQLRQQLVEAAPTSRAARAATTTVLLASAGSMDIRTGFVPPPPPPSLLPTSAPGGSGNPSSDPQFAASADSSLRDSDPMLCSAIAVASTHGPPPSSSELFNRTTGSSGSHHRHPAQPSPPQPQSVRLGVFCAALPAVGGSSGGPATHDDGTPVTRRYWSIVLVARRPDVSRAAFAATYRAMLDSLSLHNSHGQNTTLHCVSRRHGLRLLLRSRWHAIEPLLGDPALVLYRSAPAVATPAFAATPTTTTTRGGNGGGPSSSSSLGQAVPSSTDTGWELVPSPNNQQQQQPIGGSAGAMSSSADSGPAALYAFPSFRRAAQPQPQHQQHAGSSLHALALHPMPRHPYVGRRPRGAPLPHVGYVGTSWWRHLLPVIVLRTPQAPSREQLLLDHTQQHPPDQSPVNPNTPDGGPTYMSMWCDWVVTLAREAAQAEVLAAERHALHRSRHVSATSGRRQAASARAAIHVDDVSVVASALKIQGVRGVLVEIHTPVLLQRAHHHVPNPATQPQPPASHASSGGPTAAARGGGSGLSPSVRPAATMTGTVDASASRFASCLGSYQEGGPNSTIGGAETGQAYAGSSSTPRTGQSHSSPAHGPTPHSSAARLHQQALSNSTSQLPLPPPRLLYSGLRFVAAGLDQVGDGEPRVEWDGASQIPISVAAAADNPFSVPTLDRLTPGAPNLRVCLAAHLAAWRWALCGDDDEDADLDDGQPSTSDGEPAAVQALPGTSRAPPRRGNAPVSQPCTPPATAANRGGVGASGGGPSAKTDSSAPSSPSHAPLAPILPHAPVPPAVAAAQVTTSTEQASCTEVRFVVALLPPLWWQRARGEVDGASPAAAGVGEEYAADDHACNASLDRSTLLWQTLPVPSACKEGARDALLVQLRSVELLMDRNAE